MTNDVKNPDEFVEIIGQAYKDGFGILPLVGAGISVQSGVPVIVSIEHYLAACIAKSLMGRFKVLHDAWPDYTATLKDAYDVCKDCSSENIFERMIRDFEVRHKIRNSKSAVSKSLTPQEILCSVPDWLKREARIASIQWRSALHFLSRIVFHKDGITLGAVNPTVVDSFFRFVTLNKRPNFAHRMVASVSKLPGCNVVLSTNFDELLEAAYVEATVNFTSYPIAASQDLPAPEIVEGEVSLIKLHGSRTSLLADVRLDYEPSEADKTTFRSYLAGSSKSGQNAFGTRRHLLVAGFGAGDYRINKMIIDAAKVIPGLRIFWILYYDTEKEFVRQQLFEVKDQLVFTRSKHVGRVLLSMFQSLTHRVPYSGTPHFSTWQLPLPPRRSKEGSDAAEKLEERSEASRKLDKLIEEYSIELHRGTGRQLGNSVKHGGKCPQPINVASGSKFGVISVMSELFRLFVHDSKERRDVFWFEYTELRGKHDLFIAMCISIHDLVGCPDSLRMYCTESEAQIAYFNQLVGMLSRPIVIFVNLRAGGHDAKKKVEISELILFLGALVKSPVPLCGRCNFYLITRDLESLPRRTFKAINLKGLNAPDAPSPGLLAPIHSRLMRALSISRCPFHISALFAYGFFPGEVDGYRRTETVQAQLERAADLELIRFKSGGLIWIGDFGREQFGIELRRRKESKELEIDLHRVWAGWHLKQFLASNDIDSAFESLHHRWMCIDGIRKTLTGGDAPLEEVYAELVQIYSLVNLLSRRLSEGRNLYHCAKELEVNLKWARKSESKLKHYFPKTKVHTEIICLLLQSCLSYVAVYKGEAPITYRAVDQAWPEKISSKSFDQSLYEQLVFHVGFRFHTAAATDLKNLYANFGNNFAEKLDKLLKESLCSHRDYFDPVHKCVGIDCSSRDIRRLVKVLRMDMRNCLEVLTAERMIGTPVGACEYSRRAEVVFGIAREFLKLLPQKGSWTFYSKELSRLKSQMGRWLALRNNFVDAHRRVAESLSLIHCGDGRRDKLEVAVAELRSADICLLQLEYGRAANASLAYQRGSGQEWMLLTAAHMASERALLNLTDDRVDSYWLSYLFELKARIASYVLMNDSEVDSFINVRYSRDATWGYIKQGLSLTSVDTYRAARLISLAPGKPGDDQIDLIAAAATRIYRARKELNNNSKAGRVEEAIDEYFRKSVIACLIDTDGMDKPIFAELIKPDE